VILDTNALSAFVDGEEGVAKVLRQQARAAIPVLGCDGHVDAVPGLRRKSW